MTNEERMVELKHSVVMANTLINDMEYHLNRQQLLLLRYMIKQIKPEDKPEQIYTIDIQDFCKIVGMNSVGGNQYKAIRDTFRKIDNQTKWIDTPEGDEIRIKWLNVLRIKKNTGRIEFSFSTDISPYLFDLIHSEYGYTNYLYDEAVVLESIYGVRLFEFIKQHFNMGRQIVRISIDDLKAILHSPKYDRYADFNRFILNKAVQEINDYTFISLRYKPLKAKGSRSYTSIEFELNRVADTNDSYRRNNNINFALMGEDLPW